MATWTSIVKTTRFAVACSPPRNVLAASRLVEMELKSTQISGAQGDTCDTLRQRTGR